MKEYTKEQLLKSADLVEKAMPLSNDIIDFLEGKGVSVEIAVIAAGIAFSTGSASMGASLPSAIDLVRVFYKHSERRNEAH